MLARARECKQGLNFFIYLLTIPRFSGIILTTVAKCADGYGRNTSLPYGFYSVSGFYRFCSDLQPTYGAAMVSTGVLRYDKRGGPDNPVILSKLKNKRQQ